MNDTLLHALTLAAALGSGIIGGTFFAFSTFIMKALARLPAAQGIAAMQSINVAVLNPWFLSIFIGTAAACLAIAGSAIVKWHAPASPWLLAGAVAYLVGTVGVTRGFNIPRNDALAALDPTHVGSAAAWTRYLAEWTAWNHIRTLAALVAVTLLIIGSIKQL